MKKALKILGAAFTAMSLVLIVGVTFANATGPVAWTGNGSDAASCTDRPDNTLSHWIFTTGGNSTVTSATLTVDGTDYSMTQNGGGSFSADVPGGVPSSASAAYVGDLGSGNAVVTISCLGTGGDDEVPPTDICPNIEGDQAEVPEGDIIDNEGNCVPDDETPPPVIHKVYVCKYVGQPGDFETLQTGGNPIEVDEHSVDTYPNVQVGDDFTDEQGHSVVIGFVGGDNPVLTVADCLLDVVVTTPPPTPEPAHLTVIKHVINDNGGTAVALNFTLDSGGTNDSPDNFAGTEPPGTTITLDPGSYRVSETGPSGYTASFSADCSGTIAAGQTKTCTVTNNDNPPPPAIQIVKSAHPDHGAPGDTITYRYVVTNIGSVDLFGISVDDDVLGHICDIPPLHPGESQTCTKDYVIPNNANISIKNVVVATGHDAEGNEVSDDDTVTIDVILGATVTPKPTKTPPAGVAFTGSSAVIPLGGIALLLLMVGTALMWLGRRGRQATTR